MKEKLFINDRHFRVHGGKDGRTSCEKGDRAYENMVITAQSYVIRQKDAWK